MRRVFINICRPYTQRELLLPKSGSEFLSTRVDGLVLVRPTAIKLEDILQGGVAEAWHNNHNK